MKKIIIAAAFLLTGVLSAQEVKPKYEVVSHNIVKTTSYYDNGQVKQTGCHKDGKLDGVWESFNADGTKQAIGEYKNGKRVGTWMFFNGNAVSEVNYSAKTTKTAVAANK